MKTPGKFVINEDTYLFAEDAMKEILFMYYDIQSSYGSFGSCINTGKFNPYLFIDCELEEGEEELGIDITLLHQGSAIAILSFLADYQGECGEPLPKGSCLYERINTLIKNKRLDHMPDIKIAVSKGLEGDESFAGELETIYQKCINNFFRSMVISEVSTK